MTPLGAAVHPALNWVPETEGIAEAVLLRFSGPAMLRVNAEGAFIGELALDARTRSPLQAGERIPLAGHEVHLLLDGARVASTVTDDEGRFAFGQRFGSPGTRSLRAEATALAWSSAEHSVDVVQPPSRPVLSLDRANWDAHRVTWTTANEGGRPVTGASLTVRDADGALVWSSGSGTPNGTVLAWATKPGAYEASVTVSSMVGDSEPGTAPFQVLAPPAADAITRDTWLTFLSASACCYPMPDGHNGTIPASASYVRFHVQPAGNVTMGGAPVAGVALHTRARWESAGFSGEVLTRAVADANGRYAATSDGVTLPSPPAGGCSWYSTRMTLEYGGLIEARDAGFTLCRSAS